jgi:hypothetical protein
MAGTGMPHVAGHAECLQSPTYPGENRRAAHVCAHVAYSPEFGRDAAWAGSDKTKFSPAQRLHFWLRQRFAQSLRKRCAPRPESRTIRNSSRSRPLHESNLRRPIHWPPWILQIAPSQSGSAIICNPSRIASSPMRTSSRRLKRFIRSAITHPSGSIRGRRMRVARRLLRG